MSAYGRHIRRRKSRLPHLGARIVKTSIAVFVCFLIYIIRGFDGMVAQSVIAAIICVQPYVTDSRSFAFNRVLGTLIGAVWGLALLFILDTLGLERLGMVFVYAMMSLFTGLTLYSCVLMRRADSASLAAIVFLCVVISYPDIVEPISQAWDRIFDTFLGTIVAILINTAQLPRIRREGQLFFIKAKDLAPDRFSPVPSSVLVALNRLYADGAKICIISQHAPAFFLQQMSSVRVNTPLIVMDGAAIFDPVEKSFPETIPIPYEKYLHAARLLEELGCSFYTTTICNLSMFIHHHGPVSENERKVYDLMKRSPYRNYVGGEPPEDSCIMYMKVIGNDAEIAEAAEKLETYLPMNAFRVVVHPSTAFEGLSSLYIYSADATVEKMKQRLQALIPGGKELELRDFSTDDGFISERDAMGLLTRIRDAYEPVSLKALLRLPADVKRRAEERRK